MSPPHSTARVPVRRVTDGEVNPAAYIGLVHGMVRRLERSTDRRYHDDLLGAGFEGLAKAIATWNPERGSFVSWAASRIYTHAQDERRRYYGRHGQTDEYQLAVQRANLTPDGVAHSEPGPFDDQDPRLRYLSASPGDDPSGIACTNVVAAEALAGLTDNERRVVALLADGLSQLEIAERLGVCQSRVSQLRRQALTRFQRSLAGHESAATQGRAA